MNSRGSAYFELKKYAEAQADYAAAAALQSTTSYDDLRWVMQTKPFSTIALPLDDIEMTRSVTENSMIGRELQVLADYYAEQGNFLAAIKAEKVAIRVFPDQKSRGGERRLKLFANRQPAN